MDDKVNVISTSAMVAALADIYRQFYAADFGTIHPTQLKPETCRLLQGLADARQEAGYIFSAQSQE